MKHREHIKGFDFILLATGCTMLYLVGWNFFEVMGVAIISVSILKMGEKI